MFNRYDTSIVYERYIGSSKFGGEQYSEPENKLVRCIGIKDVWNGNSITQKRVYHVDFEIKEKDRIDGRLVVDVVDVVDIMGKHIFWKCGAING